MNEITIIGKQTSLISQTLLQIVYRNQIHQQLYVRRFSLLSD